MFKNTSDILHQLYIIFDNLNEHYFDSELPKPFIVINPGKNKKKSVYGTFTHEMWAENQKEIDEKGEEHDKVISQYHEISISAEYLTRPFANLCATLCHEMVHMYCFINDIEDTSNNSVYHNKRFKTEAEKRGLIIDKEKTIGYSITTPSQEFINFISSIPVDENCFTYYRQTFFDMDDEGKITPKKRYICPYCGLIVSAKKEKNIVCGECDTRLDYWDIGDPDNPELIEDYNGGKGNEIIEDLLVED